MEVDAGIPSEFGEGKWRGVGGLKGLDFREKRRRKLLVSKEEEGGELGSHALSRCSLWFGQRC